MEMKDPDTVRQEAVRKRDEILRKAGIYRKPKDMRFTLVGEWRPEGEDTVHRSHIEGSVTGFSIDQTERTDYKDGLSLIVDQPFIFDLNLLCLVPKDPAKNLWTALFCDDSDPAGEASYLDADVFVFFDLS